MLFKMFKVGDLVKFTRNPDMFDLFEDDFSIETKIAIILKVKLLLKRVDLLTQTENKTYTNVSFNEIEKIN